MNPNSLTSNALSNLFIELSEIAGFRNSFIFYILSMVVLLIIPTESATEDRADATLEIVSFFIAIKLKISLNIFLLL